MPATADPDATLLLIVGADREGKVVRDGTQIHVQGSSDIYGLLQGPEPEVYYHRFHVTPNIFRQNRIPELGQYRCLLNLITEPEGNHRVLDNLRRVLRGARGRVINRPEAVLQSTRDQVARRLTGIPGLRVPRVVRIRAGQASNPKQAIERAKFEGPFILRAAGAHTGRIVGLFDHPEQLPETLERGCDYLATEFVDFRSADGLYRKYRMWFIGDKMLIRHMFVSDHWNVHGKDRDRFMAGNDAIVAEERAIMSVPEGNFDPTTIDTLKAARKRLALDFLGIDFGIAADGRLVLFEANSTMNFFPLSQDPQFAHLLGIWAPARKAFRELVGVPIE